MAPRATEGERAWLDIDSHLIDLIRDESGQWRVRCELCNKHYKLPGRYRSLDGPTRAFNSSTVDSRYRCNEAAFELIGTDREVQAGFGFDANRQPANIDMPMAGRFCTGQFQALYSPACRIDVQ
ncbi:BQ5605_C001g00664 [Microbotryum silenes-dioicae]|uniref:BQ5605_C001g00664 protein n=1 Tax=Microbotryum silenes-dioicae TaxID=796604 RepID=A0A2X0MYJ5_9BASI|nr:BQ5605_C001g00664 [Microbotryum silenes-dioicae]